MKIERVKISEVKPNPNNPRIIKDDKFRKLVKSIQEFPEMLEIRPIVVNQDMIVLGGNMRLKACKEAGLKEVPIIYVDNLTEDQQREFIIKDNVSGGEWDWEVLANEWDTELLDDWGLDLQDIEEQIDQAQENQTIHLDKSLQVLPKKEYIIIYADEDSDEWEKLKQIFSCQIVRQGGCTVGSTSDKATTGLQRVFSYQMFEERIIHEFRNRDTK